jgi:release factor glutamine methyltransferase
MTIGEWLDDSLPRLCGVGIDSARLDAELLLADVLGKPLAWLLAHSDFSLPAGSLQNLDKLLKRRLNREPMAYILGKKEFYGREFLVSPDVLIPRPETEVIVDIVKEALLGSAAKAAPSVTTEARRKGSRPVTTGATPFRASQLNLARQSVLDIGTGSGAIAVTLACELPDAEITASDISTKALTIAKQNADRLGAKVKFVKSDLLQNIGCKKFNIIVANLPYIDKAWPTSPEIAYEPKLALLADDNGLALIKKLIVQSPQHLTDNGQLILEIDNRQTDQVKELATAKNWSVIKSSPFAIVLNPPQAAEH